MDVRPTRLVEKNQGLEGDLKTEAARSFDEVNAFVPDCTASHLRSQYSLYSQKTSLLEAKCQSLSCSEYSLPSTAVLHQHYTFPYSEPHKLPSSNAVVPSVHRK